MSFEVVALELRGGDGGGVEQVLHHLQLMSTNGQLTHEQAAWNRLSITAKRRDWPCIVRQ